MFHVTFFLILYNNIILIGCWGHIKGKISKKHLKIFSSEIVYGMKPVLCIHVPDSSLYIICVFSSPEPEAHKVSLSCELIV